MNQELQDSVIFSDLAYTIKATLSHKITISNEALPFQTNNTTLQFNHLARYKAIFKQKRLSIRKILSHKKRRSGKTAIFSKLCNRTLAALQKRAARSACDGELENYNQISLLLLVQTNQRVLDYVLTSTQVRFTAGRMARKESLWLT